MLIRTPGFTLAAVAALALGIGANSAIFSVINTVLLRPLAYPDPDRIVRFCAITPNGTQWGASVPKFANWRSQAGVIQDAAAYDEGGAGLNLTGVAYPEQIRAAHVTVDYFRLFGARTMIGRTFTQEEDRPNGGRLVVLSYGLWQRRFASDPNVAGKTVDLSGEPYTILGVIGPEFVSDPKADLWLPFQFDLNTSDQSHYFLAAARLRPGVTLAQANSQLALGADEFKRRYPNANQKMSFGVRRLQDQVVGDARKSLLVLAGAVFLVLLIACTNVANLLLVRGAGRKREIAIRAALGAGRARIARTLLAESLLLFLAGGAAGLALGAVGVRVLLALNPGNIPRIGEHGEAVTMDWRVVAFTLGISLLTGIVFGLIPALGVSRADLNSGLKESGGRSGTGLRHNAARSLLVVSEMALAVVLLIGAALLIRTFVALRTVNPGFNPKNVLTMRVSLSGPRFQKSAGVGEFLKAAKQRVEAMPSVVHSAGACCLPLEGGFGLPFNIAGRPLPTGERSHGSSSYTPISAGYFETFEIPMIRGRSFTIRDDGAAQPVAIINQALARKFWPKGDPMNDRLIIGKGVGPVFEDPPRQIIGISADVRDGGLNRDPFPEIYIPLPQVPDGVTALNSRIGPMTLLVRTQGDPRPLTRQIEKAVQEASGGLPVADIRTMSQVVVESTARADFNMLLLTIFGMSALALAAIGIYGLAAYSVEQRTAEIGIRMALGADASRVRGMVLLQGMRLVWIGGAIGLAAAFALSRLIASFLFGVKPADPMVFVLVPVVLSAVALGAVWWPAKKATRIAPSEALRYE
jgi:predicted permease